MTTTKNVDAKLRHKEKMREYRKRFYAKHPEKVKACVKSWQDRNPEKTKTIYNELES